MIMQCPNCFRSEWMWHRQPDADHLTCGNCTYDLATFARIQGTATVDVAFTETCRNLQTSAPNGTVPGEVSTGTATPDI